MGYPTPIEWTDATWNPIGGCSIASPGCGPCYAQKLAGTRLKHHPLYRGTTHRVKGRPVFNGTMTAAPDDADVWTWPLRWRGAALPKVGPGAPSLIFVGDMSDLYHENRDRKFQDRTVGAIAHSPHIGQLLTKRPQIMSEHLAYALTLALARKIDLRERVWAGASAERQKEFDGRWPHLRRLAALGFTVFISYEPAMGPLVLPADFLALRDRAWLIAGGPSGDRAWSPHPDWFRRVRDDCGSAGVPFFFKQWGEWASHEVVAGGDLGGDVRAGRVRIVHSRAEDYVEVARMTGGHSTLPGSRYMARAGKKAAGRLLDGREWNEFPAVAP